MPQSATVSSSPLSSLSQGIVAQSMPGDSQGLLDYINSQLDPNSPADASGRPGIPGPGGSGEILNPYQSTPIASLQYYWGGKGDKAMSVDAIRGSLSGPAWQTYNQIIQQHPELEGQIYNPDVIAMAMANKGGATPDSETNLAAQEFRIQNALLNQPAVVATRGGQYVDLTQTPQAQQMIQTGDKLATANSNYMQKYGDPTSAWTGFTSGVMNVVTDPLFMMAAAALTLGAAGAAAGGIGAVSDASAGTGAFAGGALDAGGSAAPELSASALGVADSAAPTVPAGTDFVPPDVANPAPIMAPNAAASPTWQQLGTNALKSAGVNAAGQEVTTGKINPTGVLAAAGIGGIAPALGSQISQATGAPTWAGNTLANAALSSANAAAQGGNPYVSGVGSLVSGGTAAGGNAVGLPSGVSGALGTVAGQQAGQAVGEATQPSQQSQPSQGTPTNMLSVPAVRAAPSATPAASPTQPMQTLGASNSIPAGRQTAINALSGQPQTSASSSPQTQAANPFASGMNMFAPISYYTYGSNISPYNVMQGVPVYKTGGEVKTPSRGGPVWGKGGGQDDLIPAYLADGEYVMDAQVVSALGGGSSKEGAKLLDEMRKEVREHSRSAPVNKIPPKPKAPLEYLKQAKAHLEK
jgi:hypothetical protein